jgi:hypothetical protein
MAVSVILKKTHPRSKFIRVGISSERADQIFDKNGAHIKYSKSDRSYEKYKELYDTYLFDHVRVPIVILQVMCTDSQFLIEYVDECDYMVDNNNIVVEDE